MDHSSSLSSVIFDQDESLHLIQNNHKFPVIVKEMSNGQITIHSMKQTDTIQHLKQKISLEKDIDVKKLKVALYKKEVADDTVLYTFQSQMDTQPLELFIRLKSINTATSETPFISARKSTSPMKDASCIGCAKKATDFCSICGGAVCSDCGNWNTNIMNTYEVMDSATTNDDDIEAQGKSPARKALIHKEPEMQFFTQCPKCRASRAQKEVFILKHLHGTFDFLKTKKSALLVIMALILVCVIVIFVL